MIKNVIFDFGQVLVHFDPTYMVGLYVSDEKDKTLLADVMTKSTILQAPMPLAYRAMCLTAMYLS